MMEDQRKGKEEGTQNHRYQQMQIRKVALNGEPSIMVMCCYCCLQRSDPSCHLSYIYSYSIEVLKGKAWSTCLLQCDAEITARMQRKNLQVMDRLIKAYDYQKSLLQVSLWWSSLLIALRRTRPLLILAALTYIHFDHTDIA